jgi:beta-glucosidase
MTMFGKFSRRHFAKLAGLSALGIATAPADVAAQAAAERPGPASFPKDFVWGTATSAYQIEGAVNEDGRGRSIWDTFSHTPGKIEDRTTGDRANEHYIRYKEDIGLIRELGAKAYRFSIAWPRVFPEGTGTPNPKGLDFYDRLIDELLKHGIEPYATLYHWDLPQALEDRVGGWRSSETSKAFGDYAGHVGAHTIASGRLHDQRSRKVREFRLWMEHRCPGLLPDANQPGPPPSCWRTASVQATRAWRAGTSGAGRKHRACVPAFDTPDNVRAAEMATRELNSGFLGVMLRQIHRRFCSTRQGAPNHR